MAVSDLFDHEHHRRRGWPLTPIERRRLADIGAELERSDPHLGSRLRDHAAHHRRPALEAPSTSDTAGPAAERVSSGSGDDPGDLADLLSNRDWNFLVQVTTLVVVAMVVLLVFTDGPVTALLVSCLLLVPPAVLNYLFLRDDSTRLAEPPPSPPD